MIKRRSIAVFLNLLKAEKEKIKKTRGDDRGHVTNISQKADTMMTADINILKSIGVIHLLEVTAVENLKAKLQSFSREREVVQPEKVD